MSKFGDVMRNIVRGPGTEITPYNRIFVVSAYSGVTNWLLEHKKTGEPGVYDLFVKGGDYEQELGQLRDKLLAINAQFRDIGLDQDRAGGFISERIDQCRTYLGSLAEVLASGYVSKQNILLAAREILASVGEAHSAFNAVNIMQNDGLQATLVDLCGFHDAEYLTIDERIGRAFRDLDFTKTLPVATGYTKGTEGIMREFDRGYSEVTFSKIAVLLNAAEAVIHKEYHLCSGDPMIIGDDKVHPICNTNFDVADQLADVGMEAIHPKASKPLETAGISIRIKNAFDPSHSGTLITKDYICPHSKTEVITGSNAVTCVEVHDTRMVGEVGFDMQIMKILQDHHISYINKATNANTIDVIIYEKDCTPELVKDLKNRFETVFTYNVAIVCAIGSNIAKPGILAKATKALANAAINILTVSQTSRQTNMQFTLDRDHFVQAQRALHHALCEEDDND